MKATLDVKPLLELGAGLRVIDADAAETAIVLAVAKGSSGPTSSKLSSKPENRLKRSAAVNKRVAVFLDILPALKREDSFVGQHAGRVSPKAP